MLFDGSTVTTALARSPAGPSCCPDITRVLLGAMSCRGPDEGMSRMKKPRPKHQNLKPKVKLGKVLVVTSGKGGVGKSTSTAALGAALAQIGQNVVVDFDIGLRNLDLILGAERLVV